jgi:hypothetical protein
MEGRTYDYTFSLFIFVSGKPRVRDVPCGVVTHPYMNVRKHRLHL